MVKSVLHSGEDGKGSSMEWIMWRLFCDSPSFFWKRRDNSFVIPVGGLYALTHGDLPFLREYSAFSPFLLLIYRPKNMQNGPNVVARLLEIWDILLSSALVGNFPVYHCHKCTHSNNSLHCKFSENFCSLQCWKCDIHLWGIKYKITNSINKLSLHPPSILLKTHFHRSRIDKLKEIRTLKSNTFCTVNTYILTGRMEGEQGALWGKSIYLRVVVLALALGRRTNERTRERMRSPLCVVSLSNGNFLFHLFGLVIYSGPLPLRHYVYNFSQNSLSLLRPSYFRSAPFQSQSQWTRSGSRSSAAS